MRLWRVFNTICKFIIKNFLRSNSVSVLIIWQTWLLISWLSVSQLTICNIHLVVWHELTDIFWCINCILMHCIVILILEAVQKSRQISLSQKQIKISLRHKRWELSLLYYRIALLLKLNLWIIVLLKFSDLLIECWEI